MFLTRLWPFKKPHIKVGDEAPDFSLISTDEKPVSLNDFRGKQNIVLYFYPKDNTPFCIAESLMFKKKYEEFKKVGAEILGVSSDSVSSHQGFKKKYGFPFPLLSDNQHHVRRRFGVPSTLGMLPGRTTYLIDKEGQVRHEFTSQFNVNSHVKLALEHLKKINSH